MKKTALTLAALLALSTNVFAAETGTAAGSTTGTAAVGTTTMVAVGAGAALLAAVVISEANNDNSGTGTVTATK